MKREIDLFIESIEKVYRIVPKLFTISSNVKFNVVRSQNERLRLPAVRSKRSNRFFVARFTKIIRNECSRCGKEVSRNVHVPSGLNVALL